LLSAFEPGGATTWSWAWKLLFTTVHARERIQGRGSDAPCFFIGATLGNVLAVLAGRSGRSDGRARFHCGLCGCNQHAAGLYRDGHRAFSARTTAVYFAIACFRRLLRERAIGNLSLANASVDRNTRTRPRGFYSGSDLARDARNAKKIAMKLPNELARLVLYSRLLFRRTHRDSREGRSQRRGLESCHGRAYDGRPRVLRGGVALLTGPVGSVLTLSKRTWLFSRVVGHRNGTFVAVLFSRVADGRRLGAWRRSTS